MPSNYRNIADGLVTVLEATITNLKAFAFPPDVVNHFPAAVVLPQAIDVEIAFGGNSFEADLRVVFLVASGDTPSGFQALYDHIDPTETGKSLVAAIRTALGKTLNNTVDSCDVTRIENIGRRELWGAYYFGFDAILHFIKSVA